MALVLAALVASVTYAPGLVLILGIAFLAIPLGCALALHRCRKMAREGPLSRWDVVWSHLFTAIVLGPAIPVIVVVGVFLIALPLSLSNPLACCTP